MSTLYTQDDVDEEYTGSQYGFETLYCILGFVMLVAALMYSNKHPTAEEYRAVLQERDDLRKKAPKEVRTAAEFNALQAKYDQLAMQHQCPVEKKPPIITLTEAKGFSFPSGSMEIGAGFLDALDKKVIPEIEKQAKDAGVDYIEVVGHTDETTMGGRRMQSSLDLGLIPFVTQQSLNGFSVTALTPVDNMGLGAARAAAVAKLLRDDGRLSRFHVVVLSAGQGILPSGAPSFGDPGPKASRRRIEIRLRKFNVDPNAQAADGR